MTNGADKHHDHGAKKKAAAKAKAKAPDARAALKKKNMLPATLAAAKGK
jgi:hypothetical protein